MYLFWFDPFSWEMYQFLSILFCFKELKMLHINIDWHGNTIILTVLGIFFIRVGGLWAFGLEIVPPIWQHWFSFICSMSHHYVTICTQKNITRLSSETFRHWLHVLHIFSAGWSAQGLTCSFNNNKISLLLDHHFNSNNRSQRNMAKSWQQGRKWRKFSY